MHTRKKGMEQKSDRRKPTKSILYDEIDAVLGCRDVVTLRHVLETGDSSTMGTCSADSDSPLNVSTESSQGQECSPTQGCR